MRVALAVLAGGRSDRLGGVIKPLLVRPDGRTVLEAVIETLGPLAGETLVVAPDAIASYFAPHRVVRDPGQGPGFALDSAARATQADLLLCCGGDQISPSRGLAERMLAEAEGQDAVAVAGQPLFAVYRSTAVRRIDPPLRSLKAYLERLGGRRLSHGDALAFSDVDTEEDRVRYRLSKIGVPTW
jgi:molybdopterin-guanine dinucleotide biosynthesis protein A